MDHHYYATYLRSQPCVSRSRFRETVNGPYTTNNIIHKGLETYIDYVESQIAIFSASADGIIDDFFGQAPSRPEDGVARLWDLATEVASMLISIDQQSTLEHLAKELVKSRQSKESSASKERDIRCAQYLVFYCIGWISMCYIPTSDLVFTFFGIETYHSSSTKCSSAFKRPLGAVLREFIPIRCRPEPSYRTEIDSPGTILTVASLNYYSLHYVGKLSIEWTEKLSDHCLLDASQQRLKLFRFPAFCAQAYIGQRGENILTRHDIRLSQAHSCGRDCQLKMPHAVHQYLYEVLLSYRLLFGLNKRSRKLFCAEASSKANRNRLCDPVLYTLCGQKDASEIASLIPRFVDTGTFDTRTDFPELGERLRQLQDYIVNQKPTGLIDIWNDHRDPHQNYGFWAVVIVGTISILLSFFQVVINIAQLVVAARQN